MANIDNQSLYQNTFQDIAVFTTDLNGIITLFNQAAQNLLGYQGHEIIGKATPLLFHAQEEIKQHKNELVELLGLPLDDFGVFREPALNNQPIQEIWSYVNKHGESRRVKLNISVIHNEKGQSTGFLFMATPFARTTTVHELTDLPNRKDFVNHIETEIRRLQRLSKSLSLLLIEIDHFQTLKEYNKNSSNHYLKDVANTLKERIKRAGDFFAHLGDARFGVYLPNTDVSGAVKFAETLRLLVAAREMPYNDGKSNMCITISLGIAHAKPTNQTKASDIFKEAENGLAQARHDGCNCSRIGFIK